MFRFRMEIAGQIQMDRGIARFADGVTDYRPIWPVIADDFYATEKQQFQTEGKDSGDEWVPLSPAYAKWKEVHYAGKPILQREGNLYSSLTSSTDPNAVYVEARKTLTLGSRVSYGIYHQRGTSKMPARPEINLPEDFKRSVMHHMQTYLVQMASRLGLRPGTGPLQTSRRGPGGFGKNFFGEDN